MFVPDEFRIVPCQRGDIAASAENESTSNLERLVGAPGVLLARRWLLR